MSHGSKSEMLSHRFLFVSVIENRKNKRHTIWHIFLRTEERQKSSGSKPQILSKVNKIEINV